MRAKGAYETATQTIVTRALFGQFIVPSSVRILRFASRMLGSGFSIRKSIPFSSVDTHRPQVSLNKPTSGGSPFIFPAEAAG